jgi:hypothetical protein
MAYSVFITKEVLVFLIIQEGIIPYVSLPGVLSATVSRMVQRIKFYYVNIYFILQIKRLNVNMYHIQ